MTVQATNTSSNPSVGNPPPKGDKKQEILFANCLMELVAVINSCLKVMQKNAEENAKESAEARKAGQAAADEASGIAQSIAENTPSAPSGAGLPANAAANTQGATNSSSTAAIGVEDSKAV